MSRHADLVISALCLRRQQLLRHFMFMNYFSSTIVKFYSVLDVVSAYLRFFQNNHVFFFFSFHFLNNMKHFMNLHGILVRGPSSFSLQREPGFKVGFRFL